MATRCPNVDGGDDCTSECAESHCAVRAIWASRMVCESCLSKAIRNYTAA